MKNFETRLWATAFQQAQEAGMEYTVPCSRNLRDFIEAGVRDMQRENRASESDLEEADLNLGRLVGEMIQVTRQLGSNALSGQKIAIREGALVEAKRLCPLWPYC